MFLVMLTYTVPLEQIDEHLEAHKAFLDMYYERKQFIFSGRRNPRTGGIILMNVPTEDMVSDIIQNDPFYQHGLAKYDMIEFTPTLCDPRFEPFLTC